MAPTAIAESSVADAVPLLSVPGESIDDRDQELSTHTRIPQPAPISKPLRAHFSSNQPNKPVYRRAMVSHTLKGGVFPAVPVNCDRVESLSDKDCPNLDWLRGPYDSTDSEMLNSHQGHSITFQALPLTDSILEDADNAATVAADDSQALRLTDSIVEDPDSAAGDTSSTHDKDPQALHYACDSVMECSMGESVQSTTLHGAMRMKLQPPPAVQSQGFSASHSNIPTLSAANHPHAALPRCTTDQVPPPVPIHTDAQFAITDKAVVVAPAAASQLSSSCAGSAEQLLHEPVVAVGVQTESCGERVSTGVHVWASRAFDIDNRSSSESDDCMLESLPHAVLDLPHTGANRPVVSGGVCELQSQGSTGVACHQSSDTATLQSQLQNDSEEGGAMHEDNGVCMGGEESAEVQEASSVEHPLFDSIDAASVRMYDDGGVGCDSCQDDFQTVSSVVFESSPTSAAAPIRAKNPVHKEPCSEPKLTNVPRTCSHSPNSTSVDTWAAAHRRSSSKRVSARGTRAAASPIETTEPQQPKRRMFNRVGGMKLKSLRGLQGVANTSHSNSTNVFSPDRTRLPDSLMKAPKRHRFSLLRLPKDTTVGPPVVVQGRTTDSTPLLQRGDAGLHFDASSSICDEEAPVDTLPRQHLVGNCEQYESSCLLQDQYASDFESTCDLPPSMHQTSIGYPSQKTSSNVICEQPYAEHPVTPDAAATCSRIPVATSPATDKPPSALQGSCTTAQAEETHSDDVYSSLPSLPDLRDDSIPATPSWSVPSHRTFSTCAFEEDEPSTPMTPTHELFKSTPFSTQSEFTFSEFSMSISRASHTRPSNTPTSATTSKSSLTPPTSGPHSGSAFTLLRRPWRNRMQQSKVPGRSRLTPSSAGSAMLVHPLQGIKEEVEINPYTNHGNPLFQHASAFSPGPSTVPESAAVKSLSFEPSSQATGRTLASAVAGSAVLSAFDRQPSDPPPPAKPNSQQLPQHPQIMHAVADAPPPHAVIRTASSKRSSENAASNSVKPRVARGIMHRLLHCNPCLVAQLDVHSPKLPKNYSDRISEYRSAHRSVGTIHDTAHAQCASMQIQDSAGAAQSKQVPVHVVRSENDQAPLLLNGKSGGSWLCKSKQRGEQQQNSISNGKRSWSGYLQKLVVGTRRRN